MEREMLDRRVIEYVLDVVAAEYDDAEPEIYECGGILKASRIIDQMPEEDRWSCGWIPCSELKPLDGDKVIVFTNNGDISIMEYQKGHDGEPDGFKDSCNTKYTGNGTEVIAWMMQPIPYKEGTK